MCTRYMYYVLVLCTCFTLQCDEVRQCFQKVTKPHNYCVKIMYYACYPSSQASMKKKFGLGSRLLRMHACMHELSDNREDQPK